MSDLPMSSLVMLALAVLAYPCAGACRIIGRRAVLAVLSAATKGGA